MSALTLRDARGPFTELVEWLESPLAVFRPVGLNYLRVEDYVKDGTYVLRAELPGVDPEKDIDVTLSHGALTVRADRHDTTEGRHRSEFRYGAFVRSIALPADADEKHVQAVYDNGVLEVTVGLKEKAKEDEKPQRKIPVMLNKHITPS
jgi:HSP20 family protein